MKTALLIGGGWPLGVLLIANAFLFSFICQKLSVAICLQPLRRLQPAHWAEKARLSYPVWVTLSVGMAVLGILCLVPTAVVEKHMSFPGASSVLWISITSSFLVSGLVSSQTESRLKERKVTLADWLRQAFIPLLLLIPHYVVLFWLAFSVPDEFTARMWIYVGIALLALAFYVVGGGLIVSRWLGLARAVPERVARIVEVAAQRVGVRPKAVYILRWKAANALAFPISQAIAFSDTAVKHLDDDELIAICVHELGHLNESRRVKRLRILGTFMWLPVVIAKPIMGTFGIPGLAVLALCILFGYRAVRRLCRAMEERADALSSAHEGESGTYARALEHLYKLNLVPAVLRQKRAIHPHLYDRLLAAGIVPAYSRPSPPSRWRAPVAILAMSLCAAIYTFACGVVLTIILD